MLFVNNFHFIQRFVGFKRLNEKCFDIYRENFGNITCELVK